MKNYSYNLFPKPLVVAGYALIMLAFVLLIVNFNSGKSESHMNDFVSSVAIVFIGLVLVSFRSKITIDVNSGTVIKESDFLGINMSSEKIKIPGNCDNIFIRQKNKKGTGYYRSVLPVNYKFKSFDIFFHSESGSVRIINTDCARAIKIAEFLKSNLKLDYTLELLQDQNPK
jgi:hypothetical protein